MHVDLEDGYGPVKKKVAWLPYAVLTTLSAITLMGFAYLHSTGWGITIDLKKLVGAFVINAKQVEETGNPSLPTATTPVANTHLSTIAQQPTVIRRSENHNQLSGMRPVNWNVRLEKFNGIFIRHPACAPKSMKWTQMECSNFRARAMKRFGEEWSKNSYWNGSQIINNKAADARINAELSL